MPQFKRHGNNIFGVNFNKAEMKAMKIEINKQIASQMNQYYTDLSTIVCYALYTKWGFGEKRLRKFCEELRKANDELMNRYELADTDLEFICERKLKEAGIDIKSILEEE